MILSLVLASPAENFWNQAKF